MTALRSCGSCTVCCTALAIDTSELRKQPGVLCMHCTRTGCGIYETRPPVCRSYLCGWFMLTDLGDEWRPDRSGILLSPCNIGIPAHYRLREGIELLALGGEEAVRRPAFIDLVTKLFRSQTPAFFAVPGPPGHFPARTFLNDLLGRVAPHVLGDVFAGILKAAAGHRFEPMPRAPDT
jgi:hypothetical protein